ncbi:hypothetical protein M758_12G153700 [Ceratodon purpureus]|nr:hypothetical protein M758_12G153700 [Ceratodon purpureus]
MGNGTSREEQLYQAVQNSNHNAVKALRRDGASLEFLDKEGRTPLILACTRGDLFEMVLMLLNLGANIKAYRPGTYGGYPLHHAAKRGLDKTVLLLLSRGADPLAVNDDSLTPLDMARNRGYVSVVRMIEDRICIFSGVLRELSGPGFLEAIAPQWLTKKIWAVILPTETNPKRTPKYELVIYQGPKVPLPRTIISITKAEVEQPKLSSPDPVIIIMDRNTRSKYKFLAEVGGDKAQLERFYRACKGIPQIAPGASRLPLVPQVILQGLSTLSRPAAQPRTPASDEGLPGPSPATPPAIAPATAHLPAQNPRNRVGISEDAALKMAIEASLRNATLSEETDHPQQVNCCGWSSSNEAGPSRISEFPEEWAEVEVPVPSPEVEREDPASSSPVASSSIASPSAPPIPILYPSQDSLASTSKSEEKESQCVVCWDAPAEGVCIPCGHLAGCMECLSEIKGKGWGCPVCRAAIDQVVRVYAV